MKSKIIVAILLLFHSQMIFLVSNAIVYDADKNVNMGNAEDNLQLGIPVVFTGTNSFSIYEIYSPELVIVNQTSETKLVAVGLWLQADENVTIEHQLHVYDTSLNEQAVESVYNWLNKTSPVTTPTGYQVLGIITQIDHHEPYGMLETRIEVLKLVEDNSEYDWYDITVTQSLTPGANYTSSSWEWNWFQYTMNGSLGNSNIFLSDYDAPSTEELPEGPFGFLWRLLGFDLRKYIPWLFPPMPRVEGIDKSDFSLELFSIRYEAPRKYKDRNKLLKKRHHYIIRFDEGKSPIFWQQTQAQYTQSHDLAQIPYITRPLASGYITQKR